jgi:hypothetical protein
MEVDVPSRPTSSAGLDGVSTIVIERTAIDVDARLAADNALGVQDATPTAAMIVTGSATPPSDIGGMQVAAAAPAEGGFFDGLIGGVLGFLFG